VCQSTHQGKETASVDVCLRKWARACTGKRLAIFGAGPLGADVVRRLRDLDANVVAVLDDYAEPGNVVGGVPVISPRLLGSTGAEVVVLATVKSRNRMQKRLSVVGFQGQILALPGQDDDAFDLFTPLPGTVPSKDYADNLRSIIDTLNRYHHLCWLHRGIKHLCDVVAVASEWGEERAVFPENGNFEHLSSRYEAACQYLPQGGLALDVGCGSGFGSAILARRARHVYALDNDSESLAFACLRYQQANISFLSGDACDCCFRGDLFDLVTQMENLEHLEAPERSVKEACRVLRPGGIYVSSVPLEEVSPNSRFHVTHFSLDHYRKLLESAFEIISVEKTRFKGYLGIARKKNASNT